MPVQVDSKTLVTSIAAVCTRWRILCKKGLVKFEVDLSWATVGLVRVFRQKFTLEDGTHWFPRLLA
jgi:hypothetical protein